MFSRVKIEKYIWLCSIFRLKPVAENIVLEFLATHFIDVKVKFDLLIFGVYLYIIYTFDISLHDMSIGRWVDKWNYFQRFKTGSFYSILTYFNQRVQVFSSQNRHQVFFNIILRHLSLMQTFPWRIHKSCL